MNQYEVSYRSEDGGHIKTKTLKASSSASLREKLVAKYPNIEILSIEEHGSLDSGSEHQVRDAAPVFPSSAPTANVDVEQDHPGVAEDQSRDEPAPYADTFVSLSPEPLEEQTDGESNEALIEADVSRASGEILWSAKVETSPYSGSPLVQIFLFFVKLVKCILGMRSKGVMHEYQDDIKVIITHYFLWIFTSEEEMQWIRKNSITSLTRTSRKNFLVRNHLFILAQYSGSQNGIRWWVKGVSKREVDDTVLHWLEYSR